MSGSLADLLRHPAAMAGHVLDVRPARDFAAGHLDVAASRPLDPGLASASAADLSAQLGGLLPSIHLPARHEPLAVVAGSAALAVAVAADLTARGRSPVAWCALEPDGRDAAAVAVLRDAGRWLAGPSGRVLWRPPDFLARWAHLLPPPAAGPVLDLACGSGRAAVWLARRGWRVTGIDHQPEALALARELAADRGVAVDLRHGDLRRRDALPAGPWAAVLMFRFLHRPLMTWLPDVLQDGAVVMLRTFRDAPGYVGNPQPRHRLQPLEAARLLPAASREILVLEEGFDADGKPAAGVVARWRPSAAG